jgi:Zn-dependent peptidase ImmA (M78 family)/DNA-binding XRE family transcriptional regulator
MIAKQVNRNYILLARESRGLNQIEFADKLGMSPANLSKIELGAISLDESYITQIADLLSYPVSFFYQQNEINQSFLGYRKRLVVSPKLLTPIDAQMNIRRLHIEFLLNELQLKPADIPTLDIDVVGSPQQCAILLRKAWGVTEPIIDNLSKLLEKNNIILNAFTFNTDRVDSRTILTETNQPIIFTNKTLLGDRLRFSLAYELGHLVMHLNTSPALDREVGKEANKFAAEFLMPEVDIKPDFEAGVTISLLGELKKKWKVSMQSLLYRADDLGMVSYNQKRYILTQFNQMGIRKREPLQFDIPKETPSFLNSLIVKYKAKTKENNEALAQKLHINLSEFIDIYS